MTRKPVLCLTFDNLGAAQDVALGHAAVPDPADAAITTGYPNILRLLAAYDLRATFFVEGWSALHYGDVVEALQRGGHEIGLHGWIHESFAEQSQSRARQFVTDGLQVLKLRGVRPSGFRAPGGRIGPYGRKILAGAGFAYDSSVDVAMPAEIPREPGDYAGDGVTALPDGLTGIPWQWFMVDAVQYKRAPDGLRNPVDLAAYWAAVLRNTARAGGLVTVICHAHISGIDDDRLSALESVLRLALDLGFAILPGDEAHRLTTYMR